MHPYINKHTFERDRAFSSFRTRFRLTQAKYEPKYNTFRISAFLLKETTYHTDEKRVKNIFIKRIPHIHTTVHIHIQIEEPVQNDYTITHIHTLKANVTEIESAESEI